MVVVILMKMAWLTKMVIWILKLLAGLKKEDWKQTVDWVVEAEGNLDTGKERGEWVKEKAKEAFDHLAPYAIEAAIGLAVGYAAKKGMIHVNDSPDA
jgi:hypothetical protein